MSGMDRLTDEALAQLAHAPWTTRQAATASMARELLAHRRATPADDLPAWRDGAPPSGANVAWLLVESPDGDGGTTLEVFLGCHDGEWWSNAADYKGESYDDYIIGNVIAWQPHYVPKPTRVALSASPAQEGEPRHD